MFVISSGSKKRYRDTLYLINPEVGFELVLKKNMRPASETAWVRMENLGSGLPNQQLEPFRKMAQLFKKKIPYVLNYIPPKENPAQKDISTP